MEEKRAESGWVFIGQGSNPVQSNNSAYDNQNKEQKPKADITDELIKLKRLLDEGVLSDVEFQEMKSKILSRNSQNFWSFQIIFNWSIFIQNIYEKIKISFAPNHNYLFLFWSTIFTPITLMRIFFVYYPKSFFNYKFLNILFIFK